MILDLKVYLFNKILKYKKNFIYLLKNFLYILQKLQDGQQLL
jgi:hypothetical protein